MPKAIVIRKGLFVGQRLTYTDDKYVAGDLIVCIKRGSVNYGYVMHVSNVEGWDDFSNWKKIVIPSVPIPNSSVTITGIHTDRVKSSKKHELFSVQLALVIDGVRSKNCSLDTQGIYTKDAILQIFKITDEQFESVVKRVKPYSAETIEQIERGW